MKNRTPLSIIILLGIAFLFLLCYHPAQIPAPWFDEGWTLSVARNWVETGRYARLLNDQPISATGMAWNFPVTGPIALSFQFFGIGVWQGRLPGTMFTIASIFFVYWIARRMYNEKIAVAAILLLLLGYPFPLTEGRQALGEPAMLFYLLAGYYTFWLFLEKRSAVSLGASMLLWASALTSKQQPLPFWMFSMLAVVVFSGWLRRDRFTFWASLGALLGTLVFWRIMLGVQAWLETGLPLYGAPMQGLLNVTGWVPVWEVRVQALTIIGYFAVPLILGLGYSFKQEMEAWNIEAGGDPKVYIRLAYWSLTTSWLIWYATLAMAWVRYLYPIVFFGSIFVAVFISRITDGFNFPQVVRRASNALRRFQFKRENLEALLVILIMSYVGSMVVRNFAAITFNNDAETVAEYLNRSTPSDALLETYDSELLFLVQRKFHFPPDQIQVELNKRTFLHQNVAIPYDPMQVDPDYIVIGPFSKMWGLYASIAPQQDGWELVYKLPNYSVYQHVR